MNKVIDKVNEITQAKNDYLKNVNEVLVLNHIQTLNQY